MLESMFQRFTQTYWRSLLNGQEMLLCVWYALPLHPQTNCAGVPPRCVELKNWMFNPPRFSKIPGLLGGTLLRSFEHCVSGTMYHRAAVLPVSLLVQQPWATQTIYNASIQEASKHLLYAAFLSKESVCRGRVDDIGTWLT